jgi:fucose 4-O-acetylase-like acetyltransferase
MVTPMVCLEKEKRMPWIDALKGIGMLAVIAGHILPTPVHDLVYTFHMPLFFFISGYLFRPKGIARTLDLVRSLVLPTISSVILILLFFLVAPSFFWGEPVSLETLKHFYNEGNFVVLWFPVVLMITIFAMEIMENYLNKTTQGLLVFLLLITSYLNEGFRFFDAPLSAAVSLHTLAFVFAGRLSANLSIRIYPTLVVIALLFILLSLVLPDLDYDLWQGDLGVPIISFVNASVISLGLAATARALSERHPLNFLRLLGRTSLVIMLFHQPIQIILLQQGMTSSVARFLVVIMLCALLGLVTEKNSVLNTLLLGARRRKSNESVALKE